MAAFPARIHVLIARKALVGVVIRRGPSKQVATYHWNLKTDNFKLGQWLKGRIYERRSDLSPDGRYMIYFAMNGKWNSESLGSWTAISRAPYLKAVECFPKGVCWHGGGLWTGKNTYWLNDTKAPPSSSSGVRHDKQFQPVDGRGGECLSVYFPRLLRDGWTIARESRSGHVLTAVEQVVFEKQVSRLWMLVKTAHAGIEHAEGRGCYWDTHQLVATDGRVIDLPGWEWAEVDRGSLIWAESGRLFRAMLDGDGLTGITELIDLRAAKFEALAAPY